MPPVISDNEDDRSIPEIPGVAPIRSRAGSVTLPPPRWAGDEEESYTLDH